jgi:uncharacterized protein
VKIPVSHGHLEALLREAEGEARGAAVICHPHPEYGGTMHTKAVFRTAQALSEVGIHALRFNFRGVGTSTGSYGGGEAETEDVLAALDWLEGKFPGLPLVVGGFSFGSRVALRVGVDDERPRALLGLGFAIELFEYGFLADAGRPVLVVQGENDEFGGGAAVAEVLAPLGDHITLERIEGADHYFHDHFDELQGVVGTWFTKGAGAAALG